MRININISIRIRIRDADLIHAVDRIHSRACPSPPASPPARAPARQRPACLRFRRVCWPSHGTAIDPRRLPGIPAFPPPVTSLPSTRLPSTHFTSPHPYCTILGSLSTPSLPPGRKTGELPFPSRRFESPCRHPAQHHPDHPIPRPSKYRSSEHPITRSPVAELPQSPDTDPRTVCHERTSSRSLRQAHLRGMGLWERQ
jgi:hypothetical protein